ncbi:hypothetical protein EDD30_3915 [Couchioplanes caeruleus]|uniref:Uncharacterized protein n=1 Tax=Couchioplanes caeruleus TaxID=56438 RepID=A0A3N1GLC3_9ACTN|nr:hypothetical protein EDD30_3915 [Couchioplanes caeruleus]
MDERNMTGCDKAPTGVPVGALCASSISEVIEDAVGWGRRMSH